MTRGLIRFLFSLWTALWVAGAVLAQTGADYEAWTDLSSRADAVIEDNRASVTALEELRTSIAAFRATFLAAQTENQGRVATVEAQLDALGDVPEDGVEPDLIADRRKELEEQLTALRSPRVRAEEAYTEADGLIGEIDAIIRQRQASQLLEFGPSPVNPVLWQPAATALWAALQAGGGELVTSWSSDVQRTQLRNNLPLILLLVAFALILVLRGRRWSDHVSRRLRALSRRGTDVWSILVSLAQVGLPFVGLLALERAAVNTGMFGTRTLPILEAIPEIGATLLMVRWLADRSFNRDMDVAAVPLPDFQRAEARTYFNMLSVLLVLRAALALIDDYAQFSAETLVTLDFPILAGCALILFRLGLILHQLRPSTEGLEAEDTEDRLEGRRFRTGLARILGRIMLVISLVGVIMSAVGYGNAGTALIYPTVMSLFVATALMVLQQLINAVYELITGRDAKRGTDSLIPVLAGFVLILVALPILALIWGARVADLTEIWANFLEGAQLGDTRISPGVFLEFVVVFGIGYGLTRILQGSLRNTILPKTRIDVGGRNALVAGVGYTGLFVAGLVAVATTGLDLSSLAIVAGALSVGIGFGLQNIVQNFVAGIILLIERPISEGDWIEVGGQHGIVKQISVRSTRIETFDRTDVIVPNGDFVSGTVTNYTRGNTIGRVRVSVGVAYGTDTRKVEDILKRIARENDYVLTNPEPSVTFSGFGADSLDFEVRAVLRDVNKILSVKSEMNHEIYRRFAEEGIEIPFAQRDLWLRNPEALKNALSNDPSE